MSLTAVTTRAPGHAAGTTPSAETPLLPVQVQPQVHINVKAAVEMRQAGGAGWFALN